MSKFLNDIEAANRRYAEPLGDESTLSLLAGNRFSILTCMEAWFDPSKLAGMNERDGHVVRNAGGRATDDAIRSLLLSYKLLDSRQWLVIHHTDCDMECFNDETIGQFLAERTTRTTPKQKHPVPAAAHQVTNEHECSEWRKCSDKPASVVADVRRIRRHPLVPRNVAIHGYIFDVRSGRLQEVLEAKAVGAARQP